MRLIILVHLLLNILTLGSVQLLDIDNSHDINAPIEELNGYTLKEVFESTIPSLENLVTNGDFSNGTTGWRPSNSTHAVSGGNLINTGDGTSVNPFTLQTISNYVIGNVYYAKVMFRVTNSLSTRIRARFAGGLLDLIEDNPTANTWYVKSGSFLLGGLLTSYAHSLQHTYNTTIDANNAVMEVKYSMHFNLTTSHGVTATSGTAYDNAVAEIEWLLSINDGYFQNEVNWFQFLRDNGVDLTVEQMDAYYQQYLDYKDLDLMNRYSYTENELTTNDIVKIIGFSLLWVIAIWIVRRWI